MRRSSHSIHGMVAGAALLALSLCGCGRTGSHAPSAAGSISGRPDQPTPTAQPSELLPADSTYAVIAGVLSWPDPNLAGFSTHQRKDAELSALLQKRGVPADHIKLLLDAQATTEAIIVAVQQVAARAPAGSTLLFYYAGHGVRGKDSKAYFASYDMQAARPAATGLSLDRLRGVIARDFRGDRVVLMADCCYSGALKDVAAGLSKRGIAALSITSAEAANVSTNNWTYTQAVIDALGGDALCDENSNGVITLEELSSEVRAAMLYREGQRYGVHFGGVSPNTVVGTATGDSAGLPRDRRHYAEVKTPRGWRTARIRAVDGDFLLGRLYDYSESTDIRVSIAASRPIEFRRYAVGEAIEVYWGARVWPAKVERTDGDFHFISYPGWPAYWNEWVTSRRIVNTSVKPAAAGSSDAAVMVEWRGRWWPASVLKRKGSRFLIHYDGYDDGWNEWVGPTRIRQR